MPSVMPLPTILLRFFPKIPMSLTYHYFSDVFFKSSDLSEVPSAYNSNNSIIILLYCCLVAKSCPPLCDPMDCSMPGFPDLHHLLDFAQTHVHWVSDAIQTSHSVSSLSFSPQSFPTSGSFLVSWVFKSEGPSIGTSASTTVLPVSILVYILKTKLENKI